VTSLKRLVVPLAVAATLIATLALATAQSAPAATATPAFTVTATDCDQGTNGTEGGLLLSTCYKQVTQGSLVVADVQWGFVYRKSNHHLRAWTFLSWATGWRGQVDKLNFGDRTGVLKSVGPVNNPYTEVQTAAVSCHVAGYYNSNNHFSLRPPGGDPVRLQTGEANWHLGTDICRSY
jgi:hypothetical protein